MTKRSHRGDAGMTIIELSVVLLLISIVSVIAFGFVNAMMNTTSRADANVQAERDGQIALRTITEDLRAANPIGGVCGGSYASCVQFTILRPTSANPNCASAMTYQVSSGYLVQNRTDTNCATNPTYSRRLIQISNATAGVNLFSYTDRFGQPISVTASCSSDPITAPCPKYAKAVGVTLVVPYRNIASPLRLSSVASLRNSR